MHFASRSMMATRQPASWLGKDARRWIYAIKVFGAAMLALYIALALGLSRPYWAMATVYLVSSPLTGATRSKGLYRVAGTLIGAAAAVAMVPALVNEPVVLMTAISLWTGAMLYLSLLEPSPRSYVFLLAAYTLPIVALPAVTDPSTIFDIALLRVEEIGIGIACASVISALIFPTSITSALEDRFGKWLGHARAWTTDILMARVDSRVQFERHRKLTEELRMIRNLMAQVAHESDSIRALDLGVVLESRMLSMLPTLDTLDNMLAALRAHPFGIPDWLSVEILDVVEWIGAATPTTTQPRPAIAHSSARRTGDWHSDLVVATSRQLDLLVDLWTDCRDLQRSIAGQSPAFAQPVPGDVRAVPVLAVHRDHGLILIQSASAATATFLAGAIWMLSGWIDGAGAVGLAALTACFVSTMEVPRRAVQRIVVSSVACLLLACFYQFIVLPNANDFVSLVTLFALPYLCIGFLMTRADFGITGVLLAVTTASFANVQQIYDANFGDLFNASLAASAGILFAAAWVVIARPLGVDVVARRILRASWRGISTGFGTRPAIARSNVPGQMLDRMRQLIAILPPGQEALMRSGLSELLVSSGAQSLEHNAGALSAGSQRAVDYVFVELARYYRHCLRANAQVPPSSRLSTRIDAAVRSLPTMPGTEERNVLASLLAIRLALFPGHENT